MQSKILSGRFGKEILKTLENKDVISEATFLKLRRDDRVHSVEFCRRLITVRQALGEPLFLIEENLKLAREHIALYKIKKDGNATRFRASVSTALFDIYQAEQIYSNFRMPTKLFTHLIDRVRSAQSNANLARARFEKEWMISIADQNAIIGHLNDSLRDIDNAVRMARVERFRDMPRADGEKESFISWLIWPGAIQIP